MKNDRWTEIDVWARIDPLINAGIGEDEIRSAMQFGDQFYNYPLLVELCPEIKTELHDVGAADQDVILLFIRIFDATYAKRADWQIAKRGLMRRILNGRWSASSSRGMVAEFSGFSAVLDFAPYLDDRPRFRTAKNAARAIVQDAMIFGGEVQMGAFTLSVEF